MNKLHLVLRMLIDGNSRRSISKMAEVSRTTVDKYAQIFHSHPLSLVELYKLDEYDLQVIVKPESHSKPSLELLYGEFDTAVKELKRVGVTRQFLWNSYKTKYPNGVGYSQYCDHLNKYLQHQQISYVFEHKAADKLMIDFAGKKLYLTDYETGEQKPVEFFVGILPCSGLTFGMACMSQQTPDFFRLFRSLYCGCWGCSTGDRNR